jgi:hypothetical protein
MARARKPKKKPPAKKKARAKPAATPSAKLTPKVKRQLAAAKGVATRKRNKLARLEALSAAQKLARAKKAKKDRAARKKAKATARQMATRAKPGGKKSELFQLEAVFQTMADMLPFAVSVQVEHAPVMDMGQQPWLLLGAFKIEEPASWLDVGIGCQRWEQDLILEATIKPQRYSFLRFLYQIYDDEGDPVGAPEGYAPTSSGAWESVISEAVGAIIGGDADDLLPETLAAQYPNTAILEIQVWFSASMA